MIRLAVPDSALAFRRAPYTFISARCDRLGADMFRTRLALHQAVCMRGAEAAAVFYTPGRFTRSGAMPPTGQRLLQDKGSVQLLEGAAHHRRKQMFMDLMGEDSVNRLVASFETAWAAEAEAWPASGGSVLHDHARKVLTRAACGWAGIPLTDQELTARTLDFSAMIDNAARIGPSNWFAHLRRRRAERWAARLILRSRAAARRGMPADVLEAFASHTDSDGALLDPATAAVELLNVLRPIVAVSQFMVFAAHALEQHPAWKQKFASGDEDNLEPFVQEVRRYYPFFPAIAGKVREEFDWRGEHFRAGLLVVLDLYGTNHDSRLWTNPESFSPERFRGWAGDPNTLIPQGGGDVYTTHRCPGEKITIELMKKSVQVLTRNRSYGVPSQDLSISLSKVPALPRSGLVLKDADT